MTMYGAQHHKISEEPRRELEAYPLRWQARDSEMRYRECRDLSYFAMERAIRIGAHMGLPAPALDNTRDSLRELWRNTPVLLGGR